MVIEGFQFKDFVSTTKAVQADTMLKELAVEQLMSDAQALVLQVSRNTLPQLCVSSIALENFSFVNFCFCRVESLPLVTREKMTHGENKRTHFSQRIF